MEKRCCYLKSDSSDDHGGVVVGHFEGEAGRSIVGNVLALFGQTALDLFRVVGF